MFLHGVFLIQSIARADCNDSLRRDQISSFRGKDQSIRIGGGVISVAWSKALCSHRLVKATISCSKYIDHSLEMSLKGGKKRVKRSGEREVKCSDIR
jgi:hypothetical protein